MLWLINKSGTPVKYLNKVRKIMNFIIKGYPKESFYNQKKEDSLLMIRAASVRKLHIIVLGVQTGLKTP